MNTMDFAGFSLRPGSEITDEEYAEGIFILEDEPSSYADGVWAIPHDDGYARWYEDFDAAKIGIAEYWRNRIA